VALQLVAPSPMAKSHGLSRCTRLLLWLLSKRPDVDGANLMPTRQYLDR